MAYFKANQSLNQEWLDALDDLDVSESEVLLDMWDPHRIPVGRNLTSSVLSIDLKPGGAGVVGQMIEERMDWEPFVVAPGIGAYFARLAELLDSGVIGHDLRLGFVEAGTQRRLRGLFPSTSYWPDGC